MERQQNHRCYLRLHGFLLCHRRALQRLYRGQPQHGLQTLRGRTLPPVLHQKKARSQSSPAKPKDDVTSEGPTIADLTAMVQQLRLENKRLKNQLAERKIEVEELRDDLRLLRRGLSAKMKRLFEATGHKDLY